MRNLRMSRIAALALALTVPAVSVALAQPSNGAFDGRWVVDVPPSPVIARTSDSACPALRLPVLIEGDQVTGELSRIPSGAGEMVVGGEQGLAAAPVTGEVAPDGTLSASWENYHATGKLSGDTGQITVQTECGPTVANVVRVSR